ncbi:MAG: DNA primase, partial [Tissierella sp.]|uniref:DNA primase n=1 Tax=Tissierella sp. TaxID=41274 RepID=UPI003F9871D8
VDIVDTVSEYINLNKSGANLVGLCPFHNEKTPSFTVSSSKQFFHCFGCGESGDSITFIMKKENLDFKEAVKFLADKLNIELDGKEIDAKEIEERKTLYDINREAGRFFHQILLENKFALEYLNKREIGYNDIKRFGLGFIPDKWELLYKYLISKGYKEEEIEKVGLINKRKSSNGYYDRFRNRIIFPIINRRNKVIGFGGRVIDDSMPKYLNSKESLIFNKGNNLYGLNLVKKYSDKKRIILVEGYMDVIALFSKGINYAVASLGTALTASQAKLLKRYGEEIYIAYDSDEAGIKATLRSIDIMSDENIKPKIIQFPKGMDPDDYIKKEGKIRFEHLFKKALSPIDYNINLNKEKYNINNVEEKIKFTKEITKLIKKVKSPIEQDVYIEKISNDTGINRRAIEKEIRNNKYRNYKTTKTVKPKINKDELNESFKIKSAHIKAQINLVELMVMDREYFHLIEKELFGEDFSNLEFSVIYDIIKTKYENNDILNIDDILKEALNKGMNEDLLNSIHKESLEYKPTNIEKVISDLINTITLNSLEEKRKKTIKLIEDLEENPDKMEREKEEFIKLCIELTDLNNEIESIRYK